MSHAGSEGDAAAAGLADDDLLASLGLDALIPASLAAWRPLLIEAMAFFLDRLPAHRLAAIIADQLALPANAEAARRLVSLFANCPTLHKLGQVVARHRQLDPLLRLRLQSLESMPPSVATDEVAAAIHDELKGTGTSLVVADEALAEGSVAVVVPFTYRDDGETQHGVFKVLKPGIEARLAEELDVMAGLAAFLSERGRQLDLPAVDYGDTLNTVRSLLATEVRLDIEQRNLAAAAAFYAAETRLLVPRLLPWCTPRMTAMERVFGRKVTDADIAAGQRQALAETMLSALLAEPFWSATESATVHADLHAGNLFLADDGRLAVLDWSLTATLGKAQREALVAIVLGGLSLDAAHIRQAVARLGALPADDPTVGSAVERALDRIVFAGRIPGFYWLLELLDDIALNAAGGFGEDLGLFRKTWLSLSGVVGDLTADLSADAPLLDLGLRRLLAELPARSLALPASRGFSTHVSNLDLVALWGSPWLISARFWTRLWSA